MVSNEPRPTGTGRDGDASGRSSTPGPDAPTAVELDGVTKRYAETTAVEDVSLTVREGEFFTLVGPSGCGKTTTLRLIAGFEAPTAGTVRFHETAVTGVPPEDRDIGVVFQNYALFPTMSVAENVAYGLNFADPPGGVSDEQRVADLLELVDLEGMGDRDPDQLSGGQRQRVAIARALAPGPDVLLLDEPMSALDARLRERLRLQVRAIQRELGITTIYVTHDQEEALAISDRVAVMCAGSPEQVGTPRSVYRRPESRFVAEFVGDNNVFDGTAVAVEGTEMETDGDGARARIDVGPGTFTVAVDPGTVSSGDEVTFCVRPENLRVRERRRDSSTRPATETNRDGAGDGPNAVTATVASAEFLGEKTRGYLEWNGRELLVGTRDPLSGEVVLGFEPDDAHVIDVA